MHLTPTVLLLASTAFALPLRSTSPPSTPLSTRGLINLHLDLSSLLPPVVCDTLEGLLGGRFCASLSNITIAIDDGPPKHPLNTTSSSSSSSSDVDFFIDDDDEAESSPSDTDPPRIVSESESDPIAEPSLAPSPSLETPPTPDDLLSSSSPVPPPPCDPLSPLCPSLPNDTTLALALPLLTEKRTLLDLGELLGEPVCDLLDSLLGLDCEKMEVSDDVKGKGDGGVSTASPVPVPALPVPALPTHWVVANAKLPGSSGKGGSEESEDGGSGEEDEDEDEDVDESL